MTEPLRDGVGRDATGTNGADGADGADGAGRADDRADFSDPDAPGPGLPPPTPVESLVNALLEAGPEVAEHVVRAAQELLLAVQVIVDAADQAVKEQQTVRANRREEPASDAPGAGGAPGDDGDTDASVHHLDLAE